MTRDVPTVITQSHKDLPAILQWNSPPPSESFPASNTNSVKVEKPWCVFVCFSTAYFTKILQPGRAGFSGIIVYAQRSLTPLNVRF